MYLLSPQSFETYPVGHIQLKDSHPSTQVPPFLQGESWQNPTFCGQPIVVPLFETYLEEEEYVTSKKKKNR